MPWAAMAISSSRNAKRLRASAPQPQAILLRCPIDGGCSVGNVVHLHEGIGSRVSIQYACVYFKSNTPTLLTFAGKCYGLDKGADGAKSGNSRAGARCKLQPKSYAGIAVLVEVITQTKAGI